MKYTKRSLEGHIQNRVIRAIVASRQREVVRCGRKVLAHDSMLLGEVTQISMSTKRSRARRHSISSLEEAAKKAAQEPSDSIKIAATMPTTTQHAGMMSAGDARYGKAIKRPLPIDASLASDVSSTKKFAMLAGGLSVEDLLKNTSPQTPGGGDQYLCLPGGTKKLEH